MQFSFFYPLSHAPRAALILGISGLIPFIALTFFAGYLAITWYAFWMQLLAQYAALILSFVGALHWGYAVMSKTQGLRAWVQYGWSVVPSLVGWTALQLPVWHALRLLAAMLVLSYVMDRKLAMQHDTPNWLMPLRALLTSVGSLSLLIASFI
jgi:Protein of unknown function (DUF3429)